MCFPLLHTKCTGLTQPGHTAAHQADSARTVASPYAGLRGNHTGYAPASLCGSLLGYMLQTPSLTPSNVTTTACVHAVLHHFDLTPAVLPHGNSRAHPAPVPTNQCVLWFIPQAPKEATKLPTPAEGLYFMCTAHKNRRQPAWHVPWTAAVMPMKRNRRNKDPAPPARPAPKKNPSNIQPKQGTVRHHHADGCRRPVVPSMHSDPLTNACPPQACQAQVGLQASNRRQTYPKHEYMMHRQCGRTQ